MIGVENSIENLKVVKRNGKKVDFNGTKIAVAIKKGFDSVKKDNSEEYKYTEKDIYKIYNQVINKIIETNKERIKIEQENLAEKNKKRIENSTKKSEEINKKYRIKGE